jgi:hypothetical protein
MGGTWQPQPKTESTTMKKKIIIITISILPFFATLCTAETVRRPMAKMTFVVKDDFGNPLPDIEVHTSTYHHWEAGEGFGKNRYKGISATTNQKGIAVVYARSLTGNFIYNIVDERFYGMRAKGTFDFKKGSGIWVPWNPTIEIEAVKILKPIPMYMSHRKDKEIPALEKEFGFDLKMDDFVAPHGRGTHPDFIIKMEEKIPYVEDKVGSPYDYRLKITFPNKGDGIQDYFAPTYNSKIEMPRYAPTNGYNGSLELKWGYVDEEYFNPRKDQNYFFRVRTEFDKDGKIIGALYGKIVGPMEFGVDWFRFRYFLNPTPLDPNMEEGDHERENLTPKPPKKQ